METNWNSRRRLPSILAGWLLAGIFICGFVRQEARAAEETASRPNILWLFLDDQDPWWGCYGNKLVKTPNLDRLAGEGMLFRNAFAANPVCSPSHTALFTGNYPTTLGCPDHRALYLRDLPEGHVSIEEPLREAGYFTVSFMGDADAPSKLGHNPARLIHGASGKTDLNYRRAKPPSPFDQEHLFDPLDTKTFFSGGAWKKRTKGQPFFAYANIEAGKAHGFQAGRRWAAGHGAKVNPKDVTVPPYLPDTRKQRDRIAMIHETVSHTDAVVGRFLDALEAAGLKDNTFVFIGSDHGRATIRHKQWLYDTGLHVPMILRWPGHIKPGSVCEELVSLIDVAPTTLAVAGLKIPARMEGLNLLKDDLSARREVFANRDAVDGIFDMSRAIRTKRFKYIRNFYPELPYMNGGYAMGRLNDKELITLHEAGKLTPAQDAFQKPDKAPEELYDVEADPFEVNNLAKDPKFAATKKDLADRLAAQMKTTGDRDWDARKLLGVDKVAPGTPVHRIARALVDKGEIPLERFDADEARKIMKGSSRVR